MSRTLGFVAGLTVPAGLYYISVLHLQGTARHVSDVLHEQSIKLENPTTLQPIVFEPRRHDNLMARIRQGWNEGIENGVRFFQAQDWPESARQTGKAISNLSLAGWAKLQPAIEEGKDKVQELSEITKDGALHAGEALGRTLHETNIKAHEFAHDAKVQSQEAMHEASIKSHQLARAAEQEARRLSRSVKTEAAEAKEYLHDAGQKAETEYQILKAQAAKRSQELKDETIKQAHEAESLLARAASSISTRSAEKTQEIKTETVRQAREAQAALSDAGSVLHDKASEAEETASSVLNRGSQITKDSVQKLEKQAEASLLSAQLKASEAWIQAQDRYEQLLKATEDQVEHRHKVLLEEIGARRLGFTSVDDPTGAEKQVKAAEKYNKKPENLVAGVDSKSGSLVPEVLQNTS